jgi:hypothetical protein
MSKALDRLADLAAKDPSAALARLEEHRSRSNARARRVSVKKAPGRKAARMDREDAIAHRSAVRAMVAARSGGKCEACNANAGESLHWDHFWGRAREESVESTWMLCPRCDREKTDNYPTRAYWIGLFRQHCQGHGYGIQEDKCRRALSLQHAKHPEHA